MTWQPIETAPKDGTKVLLLEKEDCFQGLWSVGGGWWEPLWLNCHGCGCCGGGNPDPTHWMPLPDPPKEAT